MAGRLEVVTGCMFAGKTEELLRRVQRAQIAGKEVRLFKPETDNRYSKEEIVTHYGRSILCSILPKDISWQDFLEYVGEENLQSTDVFAFDEAQFFESKFPMLCEQLVYSGKRVIVAGLDLNFREEPFGPMPVLLALADEVVKLTAVCTVCGEPATRSQRLERGLPIAVGPEVKIGGLENYTARCREHFVHSNRSYP